MSQQSGELKRVLGFKDLFAQAAGHIIIHDVAENTARTFRRTVEYEGRHGSGAAHHNKKFDIDESGLWLGVAAELAFVTMP